MPLLTNHSDEELLNLLQQGDVSAFDEIYNRYWDSVYNQAFKGLRDIDAAKDITQEVFFYLWSHQAQLSLKNLPAYLYTSVRNNVFRLLKKQGLFVPISDLVDKLQHNASPADFELLHRELTQGYASLVNSLPPAQQTIFKMRYDEDLTTAEIASNLNISRKTVQNQLTRAVSLLRAALMTIAALIIFIKQ